MAGSRGGSGAVGSATLIIPELALETKLRLSDAVSLNSELELSVGEFDLADQVARFRVLS